jgi:hypothetical protein
MQVQVSTDDLTLAGTARRRRGGPGRVPGPAGSGPGRWRVLARISDSADTEIEPILPVNIGPAGPRPGRHVIDIDVGSTSTSDSESS